MKLMDFLNWSADGGERSEYVRDITDLIIERFDCPNGDAQGIVEAQAEIVVQGWDDNLSPEQVVEQIANQQPN